MRHSKLGAPRERQHSTRSEETTERIDDDDPVGLRGRTWEDDGHAHHATVGVLVTHVREREEGEVGIGRRHSIAPPRDDLGRGLVRDVTGERAVQGLGDVDAPGALEALRPPGKLLTKHQPTVGFEDGVTQRRGDLLLAVGDWARWEHPRPLPLMAFELCIETFELPGGDPPKHHAARSLWNERHEERPSRGLGHDGATNLRRRVTEGRDAIEQPIEGLPALLTQRERWPAEPDLRHVWGKGWEGSLFPRSASREQRDRILDVGLRRSVDGLERCAHGLLHLEKLLRLRCREAGVVLLPGVGDELGVVHGNEDRVDRARACGRDSEVMASDVARRDVGRRLIFELEQEVADFGWPRAEMPGGRNEGGKEAGRVGRPLDPGAIIRLGGDVPPREQLDLDGEHGASLRRASRREFARLCDQPGELVARREGRERLTPLGPRE
ncbi:MAG: hypothetical protein MUC96_23385 [Myxococcaceae bacterium]|nr:hypothetical protein [Myxococcaceae bacterium]